MVKDQQELAVPGVTVTATSPDLQGARTTVTDAQGLYALRALPPGSYEVKFELAGFGTVTRNTVVPLGLTVEQNGLRERCVLRWWMSDGGWEWIRRAVSLETAVLAKLEATDIPAPRVIASTRDAGVGGPAVLMTRLPGKVYLMPRDRERWLRQMEQMQRLTRVRDLTIKSKGPGSGVVEVQLSMNIYYTER